MKSSECMYLYFRTGLRLLQRQLYTNSKDGTKYQKYKNGEIFMDVLIFSPKQRFRALKNKFSRSIKTLFSTLDKEQSNRHNSKMSRSQYKSWTKFSDREFSGLLILSSNVMSVAKKLKSHRAEKTTVRVQIAQFDLIKAQCF